MKQSAGTLLYRTGPDGIEVLIVHPAGAYNRNKPWSIPKGEADPGEDLEAAARRETWEETGIRAGPLVSLGSCDYPGRRKRVHCFAGEAPADQEPRLASWEVDQACFVSPDRARELLLPAQRSFVDRLIQHLNQQEPSSP